MLQEDYRVTLDSFQGPLDLLLFLIRRAEVDITDIPIARITDQYLAFLSEVDDVDVELAGEFLVMASTLIEMKSRTLMPAGSSGAEGEEAGDGGSDPSDPRFELVQQLLAYQRFRVASEELDDRRHAFAQRYPRRPGRVKIEDDLAATGTADHDAGHYPDPGADHDADPGADHSADHSARHYADPGADEPTPFEIEDVHVMDLAEAYERIMASIDFTRLGDHVVEVDDTPIALHQADLLDRLHHAADRRLTLQSVFAGQAPVHRVGLFLATLELARTRAVRVKQDDIEAEIEIVLREDEEDGEEGE